MWEYLKKENKEKLERLNPPGNVSNKIKVLVHDVDTPYTLDILPNMEIVVRKTRKSAMHGNWCGQIIKLIYPNAVLYGSGFDVEGVINYAIENNIKIISSSITFRYSGNYEALLKKYYDWGGIYIAPAGNAPGQKITYPGKSPYTICVSATNSPDNDGEEIDVTADSYWFLRNKSPGMYIPFNGTSAAVPAIAGCVAHILARYPSWNCEDVRKFLYENSTTDMTSLEEHERFFSFPEDFGKEVDETLELRKGKIQFAVIHHTSKLAEYTAEEVLKVQLADGYATYGYNKLIEPDGKVVAGRDAKYRGAHALMGGDDPQYWNENSLGYCLIWDGQSSSFPDIMYRSLAKELKKDGFKPAQIRLHKEVSNTLCPGRHFDKGKLLNLLEKEWEIPMPKKKDYSGHYFEADIEQAKKLGLMVGKSDDAFEPDKPVTRAELAAILTRVVNLIR